MTRLTTGLIKSALIVSVAGLATSVVLAESATAPAQTDASPKQVGDFALLDQNGVFHQLSRYRPAIVSGL
jgi:hypothetical protein